MRRFCIAVALAANGLLPCLHSGLFAGEPSGPARYKEIARGARTKLVAVLGGPEEESTRIFGAAAPFAFSADGKRAVAARGGNPYLGSGNEDGSVLVIDVPSGAIVRELKIPKGWATALALSGDGNHVLAGILAANQQGNQTYEVGLLDPVAGKDRRLTGLQGPVIAVAVAADGRRAVYTTQDGKVHLWDLTTKQKARELGRHQNQVNALALAPDGKVAVSADQVGTAKVWDLAAGKEVRTLVGHQGVVTSIAFAADGRRVAVAGYGPDVKVWDVASGKELRSLKRKHEGNDLSSVALSPDGKRLVVVRIWINAARTTVTSAVSCWDVDDGKERWTRATDFLVGSPEVLVLPDGKQVLSGGGPSPYVLWNLDDGKEVRVWGGHKGPVTAVAYSRDGKTLFSAGQDKTAKAWDVNTGRELKTFTGHYDAVTALAVTADSKRLLTGSVDYTLKLWDVAGGKEPRTFKGHTGAVTGVAMSADGKLALSGSSDRTLKLWDVVTGNLLRTLTGHGDGVTSVALSPDGKWALSGSQDHTAKLWNLADDVKEPVPATLAGHDREVTRVVFLADGKHALTASQDRTAILWDLGSAKALKGYRGHSNWITDGAVSPDGKQVLTASDDLTVRLWDAQTAKELDRIDLGRCIDVPRSVAFAPDGRSFVVGTLSWTILRFELTPGQ